MFALILFCSNCKKSISQQDIQVVRKVNFDKAIKKDRFLYSEFISESEFVRFETNNESVFTSKPIAEFTENEIVLFDKGQIKILIYTKDGVLKNIIKPSGAGRGKFQAILSFDYDKHSKNIFIIDPTQNKVLYYSLDGKYVGECSYVARPSRIEVVNNNIYLLMTGENSAKSNYHSIESIAVSNSKSKHFIKRKKTFVNNIQHAKFFNFTKVRDTIYYWEDLYESVYTLHNNSTELYTKPQFQTNQISRSELQSDSLFNKNWSEKFYIIEMTATVKYLFFKTNRRKEIFHYIYDKESGDLYESRTTLIDDINGGPSFWPMNNTCGDHNYCFHDIYKLKKGNIRKESTNLTLNRFVDNSIQSDNPILQKVVFK